MMIGAAVQHRPREGALREPDYALMREAGVEWVRMGFRPPFADATMTALAPAFEEQEREVEALARHDLKVMGYTPFPGGDPDIGGHYPAWGGPLGSDGYFAAYEEVCAWLAMRFAGIAGAWQVANELNHADWHGGLTPDQGVTFLRRGARGLKRGNPAALVGFNMAGFDEVAMAMYRQLFSGDSADFDYLGADGYCSPDHWPEKLEQLKALTDKPLVVQEFGYASAGATLTAEQLRTIRWSGARDRCTWLAWPPSWGARAHTPEVQAEYVGRCMALFAAEPRIVGVFVWRWNDAPRCWLCGRPSEVCPGTGHWGLVDSHERPKPSFAAFQHGAALLREAATARA